MLLLKRGRLDIATGVALLTTRVREPTEGNLSKLVKMMSFLKRNKDEIL